MNARCFRLALALLWLVAVSPALAEPVGDYETCALDRHTVPVLPGHTVGVFFVDPGNLVRFTQDGQVMPNVYVLDRSVARKSEFAVGSGDKIEVPFAVRAMRPDDLGSDRPAEILARIEINRGRGVHGLNGMLVTGWTRLDGHDGRVALPLLVARLTKQVNALATAFQTRIAPFFSQKRKGREARAVQVTWQVKTAQLRVRFSRAVFGHDILRVQRVGASPRMHYYWEVPFLTVCWHCKVDGKVLAREVVPPGDPLATARKYNSGGSPW